MDDEIKGEGNSVNYKYRMHDPRIGRFFAIDPLSPEYPFWTPYAFSGNMVIAHRELEGLEPEPVIFGPNHSSPKNPNVGDVFKITSGSLTSSFYYHGGGKYTKPGWYKGNDYLTLTRLKTQKTNVQERLWGVANYGEYVYIGRGKWDDLVMIATSASVFSKNAKIAGNTPAIMAAQGKEGTRENAYRHTLLSAMITYVFGAKSAEEAMNAHEKHPNQWLVLQNQNSWELRFNDLKAADDYLDLLNNYEGREIAKKWSGDLNRKEQALLVLDHYRDNGLWVTAKAEDGSGYKVWKHKLTEEEYDRARKNIEDGNEWGFNSSDGDRYKESNKYTLKNGFAKRKQE